MHRAVRMGLAAIPALITSTAAWRASANPDLDLGAPAPQAAPSPAGVLRVMTLNTAHGRATAKHQAYLPRRRFRSNLRRIGDVIAREAPDVVALQEADGPSVWSGHFDHVQSLANYGQYPSTVQGSHAVIRWPFRTHYGTALLGQPPLHNADSVAFNENWRDSKGYVVATVDVPDLGEIDVVSVHLDFLRGGIRERQVGQMVQRLQQRQRPLIVLGDLNCDTDAAAWQILTDGLDLHGPREPLTAPTYPAEKPRTRIDWVLISDELTFASHRVIDDVVSDHRGIVAEIVLKPSQ